MSDHLAIRDHFQPAMTMADAVERFNAVAAFARGVLHEGCDFGKIPGTDKPTLLKPGAEKLTTFFGLSTRFVLLEKTEDWAGDDHGGEPLFYYVYRCQLWRGDLLVAESDASCNSRESKYRWRNADRLCPECGKPTIIKGRAEYGGGFLCYAKRGGCGAKFKDSEPAIVQQVTGRVPNPDIFDQINTLQKMAQKRALIAATLLAVNASEFFTQDMEDIEIPGLLADSPPPPPPRVIEAPRRGGQHTEAPLFDDDPAPASDSRQDLIRRLKTIRDGAQALGCKVRQLTARLVDAMTDTALDNEIDATGVLVADLIRHLWREIPDVTAAELATDLEALADDELLALAADVKRRYNIREQTPIAA